MTNVYHANPKRILRDLNRIESWLEWADDLPKCWGVSFLPGFFDDPAVCRWREGCEL